MLRSLNDLENYAIGATDGSIGHVKDFYFDDDSWVIRYLVVDTGSWLSSRKVLISPVAIRHPDWAARLLPVSLSKAQVKSSPDIDTDKPVSRQHEIDYLGYYGYMPYWGGAGMWGEGLYPYTLQPDFRDFAAQRTEPDGELSAYVRAQQYRHRHDDPHLRSCKAVAGYHVHATDGEIGHVEGLLVDEETWAIRYMIVNTSNWWLGHKVLIAPQWITDVSWAQASVSVDLTRLAVKDSPVYDPSAELDREREIALYDYYGRDNYWSNRRALAAEAQTN